MNKILFSLIASTMALSLTACDAQPSADRLQREQQEQLSLQGAMSVGMPAIVNFAEKRMFKDILELRDQEGLTTYTYLYNEMTGKLIYFGETIGYGIPYATQFTSPEKDIYSTTSSSVHFSMPQADPNGLFSPASAEGTWILMKDPNGKDVKPVYVEPRIIVSPFKLKVD
jgi:hypothetical protein